MNVSETLGQPNRKWRSNVPAAESAVASLQSRARVQAPLEYLDLLRFSDGGEGPVASAPLWFQLYSIDECLVLCHNDDIVEQFPSFMFFGSNGGLESIAFDLRTGPPWAIVMVDQIAGPESAQKIAPDMTTFINSIGLEPEE